MGRCEACDACLTSKIGWVFFFFAKEDTSGLYGLIKRGAHTLWILTLMRTLHPTPTPLAGGRGLLTPAVFTPGNTSVFHIQESVCFSLNLCATNVPFFFPFPQQR